MRLSMKTRVFSIVGIMLLVTLVVVAASFYGISRLIATMEAIGRQGQRTIDLERIDKIVLNRRIATTDVIMTPAEADMKAIIDGPFAQLPGAMEAELADYLAHSPVPTPPEIRERHDTMKTLWAEYVKQTDAVAALSYENSNNKAIAVNEGLQDFWDSLDGDCLRLAELLRQNGRTAARAEAARISLLRFRLNLSKYMPEEDPARSLAFKKATEEYFAALHDNLDELSKTTPAEEGGETAAEILWKVQATGDDAFRRMADLVDRATNVRAKALLASDATQARAKLDSYTTELQTANLKAMTDGLAEGAALGASVVWLVGAISVVGIVVSVALAVVVVSSLVGGLKRIIDRLTESSEQVTAAAGQISLSSQTLAEGSTSQAASLEETSSALEEMASMTRQNADNANKTNGTTQNNAKHISSGSVAVGNMSHAMSEITDSAEQISRIIKTIEDIATNIRAGRMKKFPGRGGAKKCAEAFGVSPQQWSPWERGMWTPDELRLRELAEFFDVTVEHLRHDHGLPESRPGARPPALSETLPSELSLPGAVCAENEIAWQLHKIYSGPATNGQRWHVSINLVLSKETRKEA